MNNQDFKNLSDRELESALSISLSDKAPIEEITNSVTPWKKAMTKALLGIAFTALTPAILWLNYILPAIGIVLLLLGFRKLRHESKEFRACYVLSIIKVGICILNLFLYSTIYGSDDYETDFHNIISVLSVIVTFLIIIFLTMAIRKAQIKASLPVKIRSAIAMIILYVILLVWSILQLEIPLLGYAAVISYIIILINLFRIMKDIDTAGYAIEAAPVKISDKIVCLLLIFITAISIVCGFVFFHSYNMQWKEFSQSEHNQVSEIKEDLLSKGFPERVLNDMSAKDIAACKDAVKVYSETEEYSVDESFDLLGFIINPDNPDTKEIRFTHVMISLNQERNIWMCLDHFEWLNGDNFYGTEAIQIWSDHGSNWTDLDSYSGRVLYDENGKTYSSPYFSFTNESYINEHPILGGKTNDIFAKFSFPTGNLNQRGYVCYIGDEKATGLTGSWINYNHQKTFLQYPVESAAKSRQTNSAVANGAFIMILDAFSFFSDKEEFN